MTAQAQAQQTVWTADTGLPSVIRVGPFDIAVLIEGRHTSEANRRWGQFSACEQTIRIQDGFPTLVKAADTLLHEVGHAIYWAYGIEDKDEEERIVATMATAWLQVFRDTPALLPWLARAINRQDAP